MERSGLNMGKEQQSMGTGSSENRRNWGGALHQTGTSGGQGKGERSREGKQGVGRPMGQLGKESWVTCEYNSRGFWAEPFK